MPSTESGTGPRLRAAIRGLGIPYTEAARRLDMNYQNLHRILNGRWSPSLEWLHAAAETLGIDPHELDERLRSNREE